MNCDNARAAYLAGDATPDELRHLETCPQCQEARGDLDVLFASLNDDMFWDTPPDGLEGRVADLIGGRDDVARLRGSHRWWFGLAGAAAAVTIVVLGAWVLTREAPPDWEVALPGTEVVPDAVGVVRGWNEPGGTRIALSVEGLDDAPAGSLYEFWFSEGDRHISSGTFIVADGTEMWVGVARRDFPRLWITLEPIDADESPSGVTVMDTG